MWAILVRLSTFGHSFAGATLPHQLETERRHLHVAYLLILVLAILVSPGSARIAAAAAPTFVGTFTNPGLCSPRGVGLSPSGDVFVGSDCLNPHIERFSAGGGFLGTWGLPPHYQGSPNGVALDGSGNVFVTDFDGSRVWKLSSSGALITSWASLSAPIAVTVDHSGDVYVVELTGQRVLKFATNGSFLGVIGSAGTGPGQFQEPNGIALDASGRIYVADPGRQRILRFLANGSFDMEFTPPGPPYDVAVGPDGDIYVIRFDVNQIYQYSPDGVLKLSFASPYGLDGAYRIAIGPTGAIYISEQSATRITEFQIDQTTDAVRSTLGRLKAMYR